MTDFKISDDLVLLGASTFGAAKDAQMHRGDGADIIEQRRGLNSQEWRLYERFVSFSDYDRVVAYIGGGPPLITFELEAQSTVSNQAIDMVIEALPDNSGQGRVFLRSGAAQLELRGPSGGSHLTLSGGGTLIASDNLSVGGLITSVGFGETVPADGVVFDIALPSVNGTFRDSHKIVQRGRARSGSGFGRTAEWRYFVDVLDDVANSHYVIQNEHHSTQVVSDLLTISVLGVVSLPVASSVLAIGLTPAAAGTIRLGSTDSIEWRNAGDTNDLTVLTTDGSDVLFFGDNVVASIRVEPLIGGVVSTSWAGLNEAASATNPTLIPNRAGTNTGIGATNNQSVDIIVNSVGRMIFSPTLIQTTNPLQGAAAGAYAVLNEAASATNPTLIPNNGDLTTGIGGVSGEISLIVGSVEAVNIDSAGVVITGNLTVSGVGPHSIGGSPGNHRQLRLSGNFVSGGQGTSATNFHMETDLTGFSGDTNFLAGFAYQGAITTQAVAESITNVSGMHLDEPFITDNLTGGGVITNAQTLLITGAPAEGINNFALRSTGNAPSLFVGAQFVIGRSTVQDFVQFRLGGSFTSGGGSNLVTGAMFASNLTSASGDIGLSHIRAGVTGGGSIVTSGAGDSVLAATLWLDEPNITLTVSDAMALAATLYISGAPTEGTSANYALFIDNGDARFDGAVQMFANSSFPNPANTFTFGSGVAQTHTHVAIIGAFTSSGISNHAERVFIGGSLTGFNADTLSLAGLLVDASITTQGATNVIADVAQLILNEPDITVGTGDTITNASTLSILGAPTEGVSNWALRVASGDVILGGNLTVSGAGPHAIGGAAFGAVQLLIGNTFTSDGASNIASGLFHTPTIVGAPGDTAALTGTTLTAGITTQTATESIANIAQLQVNEPFITDNLTGLITQASTVLITGAPTEGVNNDALRVISGSVFFGGTTTTFGRIKTVTRQTTTYTILVTDSVVFGNTDSAGFTATLPAGVSGQTFKVINSGSSGNILTVAPDGSEDLLGVNSSFSLFDGEALDLTYDATDGWY